MVAGALAFVVLCTVGFEWTASSLQQSVAAGGVTRVVLSLRSAEPPTHAHAGAGNGQKQDSVPHRQPPALPGTKHGKGAVFPASSSIQDAQPGSAYHADTHTQTDWQSTARARSLACSSQLPEANQQVPLNLDAPDPYAVGHAYMRAPFFDAAEDAARNGANSDLRRFTRVAGAYFWTDVVATRDALVSAHACVTVDPFVNASLPHGCTADASPNVLPGRERVVRTERMQPRPTCHFHNLYVVPGDPELTQFLYVHEVRRVRVCERVCDGDGQCAPACPDGGSEWESAEDALLRLDLEIWRLGTISAYVDSKYFGRMQLAVTVVRSEPVHTDMQRGADAEQHTEGAGLPPEMALCPCASSMPAEDAPQDAGPRVPAGFILPCSSPAPCQPTLQVNVPSAYIELTGAVGDVASTLWEHMLPYYTALHTVGVASERKPTLVLYEQTQPRHGQPTADILAAFSMHRPVYFVDIMAAAEKLMPNVVVRFRSLLLGWRGRAGGAMLPSLTVGDAAKGAVTRFRHALLAGLPLSRDTRALVDQPPAADAIRVTVMHHASGRVIENVEELQQRTEALFKQSGMSARVRRFDIPFEGSIEKEVATLLKTDVLVGIDGRALATYFIMRPGCVVVSLGTRGSTAVGSDVFWRLGSATHVRVLYHDGAPEGSPDYGFAVDALRVAELVLRAAQLVQAGVRTPVPITVNQPAAVHATALALQRFPRLARAARSMYDAEPSSFTQSLVLRPAIYWARFVGTEAPPDLVKLVDAAMTEHRQLIAHLDAQVVPAHNGDADSVERTRRCQYVALGVLAQQTKVDAWIAALRHMQFQYRLRVFIGVWDVATPGTRHIRLTPADDSTPTDADAAWPDRCEHAWHRVTIVNIPDTTWTQGRNILAQAMYAAEVERGQQFKYWAFSDGDMAPAKCSLCPEPTEENAAVVSACCFDYMLRDVLLNEEYDWAMVGNLNQIPEAFLDMQNSPELTRTFLLTDCQDAMLNAFHRDAVHIFVPYFEDLDYRSWWSSQGLLYRYSSGCVPLAGVIMGREVMPTTLESAPYPRGRDEELENAVVAYRTPELVKYPLNKALNPFYICNLPQQRWSKPRPGAPLPPSPTGEQLPPVELPAWRNTSMFEACSRVLLPRFISLAGNGVPPVTRRWNDDT